MQVPALDLSPTGTPDYADLNAGVCIKDLFGSRSTAAHETTNSTASHSSFESMDIYEDPVDSIARDIMRGNTRSLRLRGDVDFIDLTSSPPSSPSSSSSLSSEFGRAYSGSDSSEDELDLSILDSYDIHTLRKYCSLENLNVNGQKKNDYINAILAHNTNPEWDEEVQVLPFINCKIIQFNSQTHPLTNMIRTHDPWTMK